MRKEGLLARPSRRWSENRGCMGKTAERKGIVGRNQEEKRAWANLRRWRKKKSGVCSRELGKRVVLLSEQRRSEDASKSESGRGKGFPYADAG